MILDNVVSECSVFAMEMVPKSVFTGQMSDGNCFIRKRWKRTKKHVPYYIVFLHLVVSKHAVRGGRPLQYFFHFRILSKQYRNINKILYKPKYFCFRHQTRTLACSIVS